MGIVLEFFDAARSKSHYDGSVGTLRRVRLGLAAGDPSAPCESYDCQCDGSACNTPKSRFRFDWNFHGSAFQSTQERGPARSRNAMESNLAGPQQMDRPNGSRPRMQVA